MPDVVRVPRDESLTLHHEMNAANTAAIAQRDAAAGPQVPTWDPQEPGGGGDDLNQRSTAQQVTGKPRPIHSIT
jgi:hypothetical protein